jgi:hypothetical protein
MRFGLRLWANLYRPKAGRPYPVIMSVTPYGKDKLPDRLANFFMRLSGVKFGSLDWQKRYSPGTKTDRDELGVILSEDGKGSLMHATSCNPMQMLSLPGKSKSCTFESYLGTSQGPRP